MMQKKSDDAVSPVIGVMLMLVITVVVAGVIAAFGTGMVGETESAPNVVLDVQILESYQSLNTLSGPDFHIRHVSGDPLDTSEIEIQIAWSEDVDGDGTYTNHYSTYSAAEFKKTHETGISGSGGTRKQPMYVKVEKVPRDVYQYGSIDDTHDYYFGDAVLTPGMRLTATADFLTDNNANKGSQFMDVIFCSSGEIKTSDSLTDPGIMKYLPVGTPVDITILHIPSNTIIYEKEVVVQ